VNPVSPGIIGSPLHAPETHKFLAELRSIQRVGEIRDVVEAILLLESAGFMTGEILHVNGGRGAGR
jgi:NAD(P)-dependent dehydrogenase (short-subunit alcohol dehydrogenase family)